MWTREAVRLMVVRKQRREGKSQRKRKELGTRSTFLQRPSTCDLSPTGPHFRLATQSRCPQLVGRMRRSRRSPLAPGHGASPAQTGLDAHGLWVLVGRRWPGDLDCADLISFLGTWSAFWVLLPLLAEEPSHYHHYQPHRGDGTILAWQLAWSCQRQTRGFLH